jgi:hypothetical protein
MSGVEFFQTVMGKRFYEGTMPELVKQMKRLNDNLEEMGADQVIPYKVTEQPTPSGSIWVVIFHHKHGIDSWPVVEEPSVEAVISDLREQGEWDEEDDEREDTYIELRGPWRFNEDPATKSPFRINEAGDVELDLDEQHTLIIHRADEGVVLDVWRKEEEDGATWSTYFFADEMMESGGLNLPYLWCRLLREVREMLPGGSLMHLVDEMPEIEDLSQLEDLFDRASKLAYDKENRDG